MTRPNLIGETDGSTPPPNTQSDQAFIRQLKQGNEDALDQLWENLYRDAHIISRRCNQTEDIGYEAAINAYDKLVKRGIHNFGFQASFRRYCWVMLTREIYRLIKKELPVTDVEIPELPTVDPQRIAPTEMIWSRIQDCYEGLKPRRQNALRLIDLEGQSPADAADKLGLSRNNVNQLVHRARRDMRTCLENLGFQSSAEVLSL